jgi:hypothetical protein
MTKEERVKMIINSNPSLFDLRFKDYVNGNVVMTEPSPRALERAESDLELFNESQEGIYKRNDIAQGDWVELEDGTLSRVTVTSWGDTVQVGGTYGGSYHINSDGYCSYSGGCGGQVKREDLHNTEDYKEGSCWIFSERHVGGGRGVHSVLRFKVWKQIKK